MSDAFRFDQFNSFKIDCYMRVEKDNIDPSYPPHTNERSNSLANNLNHLWSCCKQNLPFHTVNLFISAFLNSLSKRLTRPDIENHPERLIGKRRLDSDNTLTNPEDSFRCIEWWLENFSEMSNIIICQSCDDKKDMTTMNLQCTFLSATNDFLSSMVILSKELKIYSLFILDMTERLAKLSIHEMIQRRLLQLLSALSDEITSKDFSKELWIPLIDVFLAVTSKLSLEIESKPDESSINFEDTMFFISGLSSKLSLAAFVSMSSLKVLRSYLSHNRHFAESEVHLAPALIKTLHDHLNILSENGHIKENIVMVLSANDDDLISFLMDFLLVEAFLAELPEIYRHLQDIELNSSDLFLYLLFDVINFDEEILLDFINSTETIFLKYLVSALKRVSCASLSNSFERAKKSAPSGAMTSESSDRENENSELGGITSQAISSSSVNSKVIICVDEFIADTDDEDDDKAKCDSVCPYQLADDALKDESFELPSKRQLTSNLISETREPAVIFQAIKAFLQSFSDNIQRKYRKGILRFNPSALSKLISRFVSN